MQFLIPTLKLVIIANQLIVTLGKEKLCVFEFTNLASQVQHALLFFGSLLLKATKLCTQCFLELPFTI